jgi:hypothetical protein
MFHASKLPISDRKTKRSRQKEPGAREPGGTAHHTEAKIPPPRLSGTIRAGIHTATAPGATGTSR